MSVLTSTTPDYLMGFGEEIIAHQMRHGAQANAAYLLPYLKPGQRILDFGCGPGAISVDLAEAVAPGGELHGIDMEESQIESARDMAKERGISNADFHVGDVTDFPFADAYFDVAHCHDVLLHVPDTQAVLAEVKRVLKPGGIIACREAIIESSFMYPDFGALRESWYMYEDILETDAGHPQMGKELKSHFCEAGFKDIRIYASFELYSTPADIAVVYARGTKWFLAPDTIDTAVKYGAATEEQAHKMRAAYEEWKNHPGALCALAFGEGLAWKP